MTVAADARLLADFDSSAGQWHITGGDYRMALGRAADDLVLVGQARLVEQRFGK